MPLRALALVINHTQESYMYICYSAASNKTTPKNCAGLTIAANSSSVVDYLDNVLERSKVMYDAGGYLHWYWKHGALRVSINNVYIVFCLPQREYKNLLWM